MGYLIAFLVFLLIISIIGFIFSILWPILVLIVIVVAVSNIFSYRKRKERFSSYTQNTYQDTYNEQSNSLHDDDVIDVEFSEEDINEK